MQMRIFNMRLITGFCLLIAATLFSTICFAQSEEEPVQLYDFSYLQVKPGMDLEFEEFIKGSLPVMRAAGVTELDVWKTSNYGVSDKYLIIRPARTPEQMDTALANPRSEVPLYMLSVMSAVNRMVTGSQDVMIIPTELGIPTAEDYEMKLALFINVGTAPGHAAEFEEGVKQVIDIWREVGVKGAYINKIGYGGNLDEYMACIFFDSFTEMAAKVPQFEQKMAEAQITPAEGVVYYRNSEIMVRCPDLSIQPEP